jgi:flagellar basal body-associated protein FliL
MNTNDIRDIKPDVLILPPWWVWVLLVFAVAAVVIVVWLVLKKRRQEAKEIFVPRQNAVEEARERLEAARKLMLAGEIEAFYVAVSDAVRQYIERQFRLRAAEQTTEEFLQDMTRSQRLRPTHKELLAEFLTQCDLVKFARFRPGPKEMEAALAAATRFVDETVPQEIALGDKSEAPSAPAAPTQS